MTAVLVTLAVMAGFVASILIAFWAGRMAGREDSIWGTR